jgi:hypothetical protein
MSNYSLFYIDTVQSIIDSHFQKFHTVCYRIEERKELLSAINDFLDESVVLPPGDWDSRNLLSISEIQELRRRRKERVRHRSQSDRRPLVDDDERGGKKRKQVRPSTTRHKA